MFSKPETRRKIKVRKNNFPGYNSFVKKTLIALLTIFAFPLMSQSAVSGPPSGSPILNSSKYQRNSEINIDTATIKTSSITAFNNIPNFPFGIQINTTTYTSYGTPGAPRYFLYTITPNMDCSGMTNGGKVTSVGNDMFCADDISGGSGSGGASALGIFQDGVQKSSPTAQINFLSSGGLTVTVTAASTATISLNGNSTNYIRNNGNLMAGSTAYPQFLYVGSSASVSGMVTASSAIITGLNPNQFVLTDANKMLWTKAQISLSTEVTGVLDYPNLTPNATFYIRNNDTYQTNARFIVSSATFKNEISLSSGTANLRMYSIRDILGNDGSVISQEGASGNTFIGRYNQPSNSHYGLTISSTFNSNIMSWGDWTYINNIGSGAEYIGTVFAVDKMNNHIHMASKNANHGGYVDGWGPADFTAVISMVKSEDDTTKNILELAEEWTDGFDYNLRTLHTFNSDRTYFPTPLELGNQSDLKLMDSDSSNYVSFVSSESIAYNQKYVLPDSTGTLDDVIALGNARSDGRRELKWKTLLPSGGGGASSLGVYQNGVSVSSPTNQINFISPPFSVTLGGASTATVRLNGSSVTLAGVLTAGSNITITPGSGITTIASSGGSSLVVSEGTSAVTSNVSTVSFNLNNFDLTQPSAGNVSVSLSSPSIVRGLNAYFTGDSITWGAGASPSNLNSGYPARASTYFNWIKKVLAVSSANMTDYAHQLYPGYVHPDVGTGYSNSPNVITSTDVFVIWGDYNGMRDFGPITPYKNHLEHTLGAVSAYAAIPQESKFTGQSSTVTRGGTWANSSVYGGSMGTRSSTLGSSVTFTASGKTVYVCMLNFSASTTPYVGGVSGRPDVIGSSFTITIDGIMVSTNPNFYAYGNRAGYNGGSASLPVGLDYAPWLYRIENLKDSEHSVAVHVSSGHANKPVTFLWGSGSGNIKYSPYTGPSAFLVNTIRPLLAGAGNLTTEQAITDAVNQWHDIYFKVSRQLSSDGLRVTYVDTTPNYDKNTAVADSIHPNNTGHQQIADAIYFGVSNLENSYRSGNLGGNSNYFPEGVKVSSSVFITQDNNVEIFKSNTSPSDYEKLIMGWDGDIATIYSKESGDGLGRALRLKAGNNNSQAFTTLTMARQGYNPFSLNTTGTGDGYTEYYKFIVEPNGLQGTNTQAAVIYSSAPILQTGTAGYDMLKINAVENSIGLGQRNLITLQRNGTTEALIDSSGTIRSFNVATSTTDFESLNIGYENNVALIEAKSGGVGVGRILRLKAGNDGENSYTTMSISRQADPPFSLNTVGSSGYSNYYKFIIEPNGLQASSGQQSVIYSSAPVLQTGTAGYDMISINAVENGVGTGERNLLRLAKNSVDKFKVGADGDVVITSTFTVRASTMVLNGTTYYWQAGAGSAGQFLKTDGAAQPTLTWATSAGGSGGASSLGVFNNGVQISSPTNQINFRSPLVVTLGGSSTGTVTVDGSSVTLGGVLKGSTNITMAPGTGNTVVHLTDQIRLYDFDDSSLTANVWPISYLSQPVGALQYPLVTSWQISEGLLPPDFAYAFTGLKRTNTGEDSYYSVWGASVNCVDSPDPCNIVYQNPFNMATPAFSINTNAYSSRYGFVGINISTPLARLHVNGDAIVESTFTMRTSTVVLNGTTYYWKAGTGSSGQYLMTDGAAIPTLTWGTAVGGGGGASSLGVFKNGVSVSSPTAQINFSGSYWGVNLGGASTATITLIGGNTNYIQNSNTLIAGSTFYVSSGSVSGNLEVGGVSTFGAYSASVPQLVIKGGSSGADLIQLQRTSGATSTFGWSLGGGGLGFKDVTSGYTIMGLYGDAGVNHMSFGVRGQVGTDTRADRISAKSFNSGTDVNGTEFQIYGSLGTGAGKPGDINFYTGTVGASGATTQTGTQRATIKNNTGYFGILTSTPNASLEINSAAGSNLRLTYNDSDGGAANYSDFSMSSSGDLTIAPSGGDLVVTSSLTLSALTSSGTLKIGASGVVSVSTYSLVDMIGITLDGNGSAVVSGSTRAITVPYACTISSWTILSDASGSAVIDIKRSTFANYGTPVSMVGAGNKPTLSTQIKNAETPTSWTSTSIERGDVIYFVNDSASTVTWVNLVLWVVKL